VSSETIEDWLRRETYEEVGIDNFHIREYLWDVRAASIECSLSVFICESDIEPSLMEPDKFSCWKWENIDSIPENFINIPALNLVKQYLLTK
jgi:8-oxo-dGTP pyrophosphatase MutT (NUDIX family)